MPALTNAVNRRRRASAAISGSAVSASRIPSRSSSSSRSSGSAPGNRSRTSRPRGVGVQFVDFHCRAQHPGYHVKRDVAGMRFAVGGEHRHAATGSRSWQISRTNRLLPMPAGPTDVDDAAGAGDGLFEDRR